MQRLFRRLHFIPQLLPCAAVIKVRLDYAQLRRLFKDLFMHENFVNDGMLDWSQSSKSVELAGLESKGNAAGEEFGAVGDRGNCNRFGSLSSAFEAARH